MKRVFVILLIAVVMLAVYVAFGTDKPAQTLREGIAMSIDEDFKIKESLGKMFFVKEESDSVAVDGNVEIESLKYPVNSEAKECYSMGEIYYEFECDKFDGVYAVADGKIETSENGKISLRHNDGKLSIYTGTGTLCKAGQTVEKGDIIGYAQGKITYKLFEKCVAVDPGEYFA